MLRTGDILGYARVSTADQDLSGQKDRLIQNGAVRVFEDVISGKTFNRPGLAALLDHARPNDTLAVIRLCSASPFMGSATLLSDIERSATSLSDTEARGNKPVS